MNKTEDGQFLSEEDVYLRFFAEMNNAIFAALDAAQRRHTRMVTRDDVVRVGLDPRDDVALLTGLAPLYCPDVDVADMDNCGCL